MLNEPLGYEEQRDDFEWTPLVGMVRGARRGLVVAATLAVLLIPLAAYVPYMIAPLWLRGPLAFGIAWLLFQVVQRAAGMAGPPCTVLVIGLTALVLVSNHLVFAAHGVIDAEGAYRSWVFPMDLAARHVAKQRDVLIGWSWFHPYALLILNLPPLVLGGGFCTILCNRR